MVNGMPRGLDRIYGLEVETLGLPRPLLPFSNLRKAGFRLPPMRGIQARHRKNAEKELLSIGKSPFGDRDLAGHHQRIRYAKRVAARIFRFQRFLVVLLR